MESEVLVEKQAMGYSPDSENGLDPPGPLSEDPFSMVRGRFGRACTWRLGLVYQLILREFRVQYGETWLGPLWGIVPPVILVVLYEFVLTRVLHVSTPAHGSFLLAGLIPWLAFSAGAVRGGNSLVANLPLLKSYKIPPWTFPTAAAISALPGPFLVILPFVARKALSGSGLRQLSGLVPLIILLAIFIIGTGIWFGLLSVLLPDFQNGLPSALRLLFFMTPVLYPLSSVPHPYDLVMGLNPLAHYIEAFRTCLLDSDLPQSGEFLLLSTTAMIILISGIYVTESMRARLAEMA